MLERFKRNLKGLSCKEDTKDVTFYCRRFSKNVYKLPFQKQRNSKGKEKKKLFKTTVLGALQNIINLIGF